MFAHHVDKRPLGEIISASNRARGHAERINPIRELAVAIIGDALHDLQPIYSSYKAGKRLRPGRWDKERREAMAWISSPDFDIWAQCTNLSADQWRSIAQRIAE